MSIDLVGVSHIIRSRHGKDLHLRDINMHIEPRQRVGLLGKLGSGMDEIVSMICGATIPARGAVNVSSEISWPIGEAGFILPDLSLATNLRFMARIYEVDHDEYMTRVGEVAEVTQWNAKYGACSRETRWRFGFGLGVCLPFDTYIIQSPECPDRAYRERCQEIIGDLGRDFGIVVTTGKGDVATQFCDRAFVLDDGKITYYEDIEAAVAHLDRLQEKAVDSDVEEYVEEGPSEDVFDVM